MTGHRSPQLFADGAQGLPCKVPGLPWELRVACVEGVSAKAESVAKNWREVRGHRQLTFDDRGYLLSAAISS